MICPYCNKKIGDNSQFCPECGQNICQIESTSEAMTNYWHSVEKDAERDNKIRIDAEMKAQREINHKKRTVICVLICIVIILIAACYFFIIFPAQQYNSANILYENGKYFEALQIFDSLGGYKDSSEKGLLCTDKIKELDYISAINMYEENNFSEALTLFQNLSDYKKSAEYIGKCEVEIIRTSKTNDTVILGTFNGEPIEWTILSKDELGILLISKHYVTSKIANENDSGKYGKYLCWSGSTLRTWLNNEFVLEAFPQNVIDLLETNNNKTDEYDVLNYDGWSEIKVSVTTEDKVYIPSKSDVELYHLSPTSLMGKSEDTLITGWLRDRGHGIAFQTSYEPDGSYGSEWHFHSSYGIRPIIKLAYDA